MLKEKIKKIIFKYPRILQAIKILLSNKYIVNNTIFKRLVLRKVRHHAKESREYKQSVFIETVLNCNSRCIFCAHSNQVMNGTMTEELYKKIIDECHAIGINNVILSVYGEFMLDKYLWQRIEYIIEKKMTYGFVTNASLLTHERTDRLLRMGGLTSINFSANGFSKEVYEKTMVGLNRDVSYEHMLYFLEQKEKLHKNDLIVNVSAVKTKINENDFEAFFNFWKKQKGVNMILPVELLDRMGEEYKGEIGELGPMSSKNNWLAPCRWPWGPLMIYFDGKVGTCCLDNDKRKLIVGDVSKQTVEEVLNGATLLQLRKCHLTGKRSEHFVCGKCQLNSVWFGQ